MTVTENEVVINIICEFDPNKSGVKSDNRNT